MGYRIRTHKRGWDQVIFRWVTPDGLRKVKKEKSPYDRRSLTQEWAREREAVLFREGVKRKDIPTFSIFARTYLEHCSITGELAPATIEAIRRDVRNYFDRVLGKLRLDEIRKAHIKLVEEQFPHLAATSKNTCKAHLAMILNDAVESELIVRRPPIAITACRGKRQRFYDHNEFEKLVAAARRNSIRNFVIVLLGGDAGLRPGEILGLDWIDVNYREELIEINHTCWKGKLQSTKGGDPRPVPMSGRLRDALRELQFASVVAPPRARYGSRRGERAVRALRPHQATLQFVPPTPPPRSEEPRTTGPVIFLEHHRRPTIETLNEWVNDMKIAAGLEKVGGVKILRHSFGRRLRHLGARTEDIQELLGHAHISTTKIYTEENIESLREYVRGLEAMNSRNPISSSL